MPSITYVPFPGEIPSVRWLLMVDGTIVGPYMQQNDTGKWVLLPPESPLIGKWTVTVTAHD